MRISGIVHQQVCQLKWYLLACLGLIMVLPIEGAIVNLTTGDGFCSPEGATFSLIFAPLLAGLIACANVQADLNEKHYIFWRSKPAGVKLFIALKFCIGLIAALVVLACPLVFGFVTIALYGHKFVDVDVSYVGLVFLLLTITAYSLCFACNVIVRKTARSWLIGMLLVCFLLVLPFMLPLDYKDFVSDAVFDVSGFYLPIMLAASVLAFAFALYGAQYDWHLKISLKAMLWVGAALVFALIMLFSSQVANIKVLDEEHIGVSTGRFDLDYVGNGIIYEARSYVENDGDKISLRKIRPGNVSRDFGPLSISSNVGRDSEGQRVHYGTRNEAHREYRHPEFGRGVFKTAGDDVFSFALYAYYRVDQHANKRGKSVRKITYEQVYLRSYKFSGEFWMPVCELDISDCLTDRIDRRFYMAMRLIDNRLIVCVNDSLFVADVTDPAKLDRIETKLDALKKTRPFSQDRQKEFAIPLVPTEAIGIEERIRFSIDLNYRYRYGYRNMYKSSIVDVHDGKIGFALVSGEGITRFDVTRWDQESIYCRFTAARPFAPLEVLTLSPLDVSYHYFVKNGKLYYYEDATLTVFDIRSNSRIRKLGHFVRMQYPIEDAAVLEDGNILLCVWQSLNIAGGTWRHGSYYGRERYLYLLENPGK